MSDTNGNKPTPGSEWRRARQEGEVIRLPSGNYARIRPVALDRLILSGQLPNLLIPYAARMLWEPITTREIAEETEQAKGYAELVNIIVPAALLSPRVVDNPQGEDEIGLDDLDFDDKAMIFQLSTASAEALRSFRRQQERSMAAASGEQDDEPAT